MCKRRIAIVSLDNVLKMKIKFYNYTSCDLVNIVHHECICYNHSTFYLYLKAKAIYHSYNSMLLDMCLLA